MAKDIPAESSLSPPRKANSFCRVYRKKVSVTRLNYFLFPRKKSCFFLTATKKSDSTAVKNQTHAVGQNFSLPWYKLLQDVWGGKHICQKAKGYSIFLCPKFLFEFHSVVTSFAVGKLQILYPTNDSGVSCESKQRNLMRMNVLPRRKYRAVCRAEC